MVRNVVTSVLQTILTEKIKSHCSQNFFLENFLKLSIMLTDLKIQKNSKMISTARYTEILCI